MKISYTFFQNQTLKHMKLNEHKNNNQPTLNKN